LFTITYFAPVCEIPSENVEKFEFRRVAIWPAINRVFSESRLRDAQVKPCASKHLRESAVADLSYPQRNLQKGSAAEAHPP